MGVLHRYRYKMHQPIVDNQYRWYKDGNTIIDLSQVDGITTDGIRTMGEFFYKVSFKSGAILDFRGVELITQFEKYNKLEDEEDKE